jgi:hypothetical protein
MGVVVQLLYPFHAIFVISEQGREDFPALRMPERLVGSIPESINQNLLNPPYFLRQ